MIDDEKKVLNELNISPNINIDEISEKLGFSKQKIYRIKRKFKKDKMELRSPGFSNNNGDYRNFFVLAKRTNIPIPSDKVNNIFVEIFDKEIQSMNIRLNFSYYTHGYSDWLFCITTNNIRQTKMFCKIIENLLREYISNVEIVELLSPIEKTDSFKTSKNNIQFFSSKLNTNPV